MVRNDLAIAILNYNGTDDTIECIESLKGQVTSKLFHIYILDNGSKVEEYVRLRDYCKQNTDYEVTDYSIGLSIDLKKNYLIRSEVNYGFAKGNNTIIRLMMKDYKYVVLLNNDTVVDKLFVEKMLSYLYSNPEIKYASCRINNYYDRSLLWNCGGKVLWWGNKHYFTEKELARRGKYIDTSFISGCALFLSTDMLKEKGLLSEDFFHGEEDFNFCWRMHKDKIVGRCLNETLVYHKVNASSKRTGVKIGKVAGYYANRIIDMHKFYPQLVWEIWRKLLIVFVIMDCLRKKMSLSDVKKVVELINKYSYNTQLTYVDCIEMGRF